MEILNEISENVVKGDAHVVAELVQGALNGGVHLQRIMNEGMVKGMTVIGERFKNNEIYLPEMMVAARAMNAGLDIIEPLMAKSNTSYVGKVVIGTVRDDLHDVGKNMVRIMFKGAGFQVFDLGIDVSPDEFVKAARDNDADLIAMSTLLTLTIPNMKETIKAIEGAGLKNETKIMVGGAPVTHNIADQVGADGYAPDCARAVERAKELLGLT
ncbi:MAG: corrinoid protein [Desulfobacterales bacterium]|nr:corrinoid protein [Desulfobacterales bacterium]